MSKVVNPRTGETVNTYYALAYAHSFRNPTQRAYALAFAEYCFGQREEEPTLPERIPENVANVIRFGVRERLNMNESYAR